MKWFAIPNLRTKIWQATWRTKTAAIMPLLLMQYIHTCNSTTVFPYQKTSAINSNHHWFYHPSTLIYHQSIIELHPPWRIRPSGIHSRANKSPNFQKSLECRETDNTGVRMKRSTLPNIVACRLQGASNYRAVSQSRPVINITSSC